MRVWASQARLGHLETARHEVSGYLSSRPAGGRFDWTGCLLKFLAGEATEAVLLQQTEDADPQTAAMKSCEAYFYLGTARLAADDRGSALADFRKCLATSRRGFASYTSSRAELDYLQQTEAGTGR